MKLLSKDIIRTVFSSKSSLRVFFVSIFSVAFSASVILSTFGIMDGYEKVLMKSAHIGVGDLRLQFHGGLFEWNEVLEKELQNASLKHFSPVRQMEAFFVTEEGAHGLIVRGVNSKSYSKVSSLNLSLENNDIQIGKELAKKMKLQLGDTVTLAFARGNQELDFLPALESFTIKGIIDHGIYEKDLRYVYIDHDYLGKTLSSVGQYNLVEALIGDSPIIEREPIEDAIMKIESQLGHSFKVFPYWNKHEVILQAVGVEKFSIGIVLQLIVIVAIFNIAAFILFTREKRTKEFFLFWALGMTYSSIQKFWYVMVILMWVLSCLLALVLTEIFNWILISFITIPGSVYTLEKVRLSLSFSDTLIVFLFALFWMGIVSWMSMKRLKATQLLEGLKQEF